MNTGEILRQAAYLVGQGWCQQYFSTLSSGIPCRDLSLSSKFCATGAVQRSMGRTEAYADQLPEYDWIVKAAKIPLYDDDPVFTQESVAAWNNDSERTQDEVIKALLDAAELWEKEHPQESVVEEMVEVA